MTQDEITSMAREACSPYQTLNTDPEFLTRFAAIVAVREREKCAKVCDEEYARFEHPWNGANKCAAAIRARGNK